MKQLKQRLDSLLIVQYPHLTRTQAQSFIMQGYAKVNGAIILKPGTMITSDSELVLTVTTPRYVGRAGFKLEKALDVFDLTVTGKVAMDAGISTGGFTDCLLQRGIARVYGVDVAYGEVHESIRRNDRLILYERTNLRYLEALPELVDLVTLDLSFISVTKVLDAVCRVIKPDGDLIVLIKPQFEAGRSEVGKGGIVSDPQVHLSVVEYICKVVSCAGFTHKGTIPSPILGGSGNQEFLAHFRRLLP